MNNIIFIVNYNTLQKNYNKLQYIFYYIIYLKLRERGLCNGDLRPSSSRLRDTLPGILEILEPGKPGCEEQGVPGLEKWQESIRNSSLVGTFGS